MEPSVNVFALQQVPRSGETEIIESRSTNLNVKFLSGINFDWLITYSILLNTLKYERTTNYARQPIPNTFLIQDYAITGPFIEPGIKAEVMRRSLENFMVNYDGLAEMSPQGKRKRENLYVSYIAYPLCALSSVYGGSPCYYIVYPNPFYEEDVTIELYGDDTIQYEVLSESSLMRFPVALNSGELLLDEFDFSKLLLLDLILLYLSGIDGVTFDQVYYQAGRQNFIIMPLGLSRAPNYWEDDVKNKRIYFYLTDVPKGDTIRNWKIAVDKGTLDSVYGSLEKYENEEIGVIKDEILDLLKYFIDYNDALEDDEGEFDYDFVHPLTEDVPATLPTLTYDIGENISVSRPSLSMKGLKVRTKTYEVVAAAKFPEAYIGSVDVATGFNEDVYIPVGNPIKYGDLEIKVGPRRQTRKNECTKKTMHKGLLITHGPVGGMEIIIEPPVNGKGKTRTTFLTYSATKKTQYIYNGSTVSKLLTQYIRSGKVEGAMVMATELWRIHEIGSKKGPIKLVDRLAETAFLDIGPANPDLVITTVSLTNKWRKDLQRVTKTPVDIMIDFAQVCTLIALLCESYKTNVVIRAWDIYGMQTMRSKGFKPLSYDKIIKMISEIDLDEIKDKFYAKGDSEEIRDAGALYYYLIQSDGVERYQSLSVLAYYIELIKNKHRLVPRFGRSNPIYVLFEMIAVLTKSKGLRQFEINFARTNKYYSIQYLTVLRMTDVDIGRVFSVEVAPQIDELVKHYITGDYEGFRLDKKYLENTTKLQNVVKEWNLF